MGDEEERPRERREEVLQPADRVDVEVVGRLVEEQDVGLRDERLAEQRAPPPAAGERSSTFGRRQRQARDHHLDLLLEPPAVALLELVLQPPQRLERACVASCETLVSATATAACAWYNRHQRPEFAEAGGDLLEDGPRPRERNVLIQPRHAQARGRHTNPLSGAPRRRRLSTGWTSRIRCAR